MTTCDFCGEELEGDTITCPNCLSDVSHMLTSEPEGEEGDLVVPKRPDEVPLTDEENDQTPSPVDIPVVDTSVEPDQGPDDVSTGGITAADPDEGLGAVLEEPSGETSSPVPATTCRRCRAPSNAPVCDVCANTPAPRLVLEVEGYEPVIYRGREVKRIEITSDEVKIGRRDPSQGDYPDIDLREFHRQQIGFCSRRHAEIVYQRGDYYLVDLAGLDTTEYAESADADLELVPAKERRQLKDGSRVMIGSAVTFKVVVPEEESRESI